MKLLLTFVLALVAISQVHACPPKPKGCPDGWTRHGGQCYRALICTPAEEECTFAIAQKWCQALGAHLANSKTQEIEQFLLEYGVTNRLVDMVLGGKRRSDGTWEWSDGTPFNYTNWTPNQPNNQYADCMVLYVHKKGWNDRYCTYWSGLYVKVAFMCEKKA